jgi:class 3 adenylate cyclase
MKAHHAVFLLLLLPYLAISQIREVHHFSDLSEDESVLAKEFIYNVQQRNLSTNDTAFIYANKVIDYFKSQENSCSLSSAYAVKARLLNNHGLNDSSVYYFIEASGHHTEQCEAFQSYYLYLSWGRLEEQLFELTAADSLYAMALDAATKLEDKTYLLNVKANQGNVLSKREKSDQAIELAKEIMKEASLYGVESHQYYSRQNIGAYFIDLEQYDSATHYLEQLNSIMNESEWPYLAMDMHNNLAVCYRNNLELDKAEENYKKAIALAKEYHRFDALLIYLDNYAHLSELMGNYRQASQLFSEYIDVNDSIFNASKFETIKRLETQYQVAKQKEALLKSKLELERNAKNRNTLLFILGGVILGLIGVYSRMTYIAKTKRNLEKEKKRSDELLLNIIPESVAEELKEKGSSEAKDFDEVTVLFSDFEEFTQTAQSLSAKELVAEINACFKAFDAIMQKHQIEKIKTIGDAYMAAGGLHTPKTAKPSDIVLAGIEMQEFMLSRKSKQKSTGKPMFEMRVGIHTGPVVAGIVGVKKFQYDIWGDTVNTASRMESASEVGKINISQATYQLIKNDEQFSFESRGKIQAKGKGEMEMWFVSKA